ncbi:MAG: DUF3426 domain-containing protein [Gammaproteobacteria bacterium]|nr:DUF3426 domain-containing protein [Gammaproteobacteria bacterium]
MFTRIIHCPHCQTLVEIADDGNGGACPRCSTPLNNPIDQPAASNTEATAVEHAPVLSSHRPAVWLALCAALLITGLVAQYGYFNRDRLAQHDLWRPGLQLLCRLGGCTLPLLHKLDMIKIEERAIASHPQYAHSLLITVTLHNLGGYPQRYPDLMLSFSDLEGRIVAQRRFRPAEYLQQRLDPATGIPAGQAVLARLELADPGAAAINYEFSLF